MEDRILGDFLDAVDAELGAHADEQKAHDAGHRIDAGGAQQLADRVGQLQDRPAEQADQHEGGHHGAVDQQARFIGGQLGDLRRATDDQRHGAWSTQAGHGQWHEGNILVGIDALGGAGGREQHAKTDDADDEAPGQPQPRDGDAEQIEDRRADEEADAQGAEQVEGG